MSELSQLFNLLFEQVEDVRWQRVKRLGYRETLYLSSDADGGAMASIQQFRLPDISADWHPSALIPENGTAPIARAGNRLNLQAFYPAPVRTFLKRSSVTVAIDEADPATVSWIESASGGHTRWGYRICHEHIDLPKFFASGPGRFARSFELYDWHAETDLLSLCFFAAPRPNRLFANPVLEALTNGTRRRKGRLAQSLTDFTDRRLIGIHHRVHAEMVSAAMTRLGKHPEIGPSEREGPT